MKNETESINELNQSLSSLSIEENVKEIEFKVGLVYDERMRKHFEEGHPEQPDRITSIFNEIKSFGLLQKCIRVNAREASDEELSSVHSLEHIHLIRKVSSEHEEEERDVIAEKFNSVYFNEGSSESALLAAGSAVELSLKVANNELDHGAAIIRPPGHHAESACPMGFCLFNNVAIAAKVLLDQQSNSSIQKILIVDWDVHHGNGIQNMFYSDPRVLYFSIHRYDNGYFYPSGQEGNFDKVGSGEGTGFNVNVPWPSGGFGDFDYLTVFDQILIPLTKYFDPDLILISAGFDAALGDPLGRCCLTPFGYSQMTHKLMNVCNKKLILFLEGGYNLDSISSSFTACVSVLLGNEPISEPNTIPNTEPNTEPLSVLKRQLTYRVPGPKPEALKVIRQVKQYLTSFYPIFFPSFEIEKHLSFEYSYEQEMNKHEVWYACYGSNLWQKRFLCYIEGGKVDGMSVPCKGCRNKRLPAGSKWIRSPHRMFFGHKKTITWGEGGVCFLHLLPSTSFSHLKLYKITLQQFHDVFLQENKALPDSNFENIFGFEELQFFSKYSNSKPYSNCNVLEIAKHSWYGTVLYLGESEGLPILTFSCCVSDLNRFCSDSSFLCPPSPSYKSTIVHGLKEANWSEEEIESYIQSCSLPLNPPPSIT